MKDANRKAMFANIAGRKFRKEPDKIASRELQLFIENDYDLYRQQHTPIIKNLIRKKKRGIYQHEKAVKLFNYLTTSGAKKYSKEHGGRFDTSTRYHTAKEMTDEFEDNYKNNEYEDD